MKKSIKVSILVDNPNSWFHNYLDKVFRVIRKFNSHFTFVSSAQGLEKGDVLFILSCDRLLTKKQLALHKNNIVIHASDLPKGRGWSPWIWQIESGINKITLTLFETVEECDAGDYYLKKFVRFNGTELIDEIRNKIAQKIVEMIEKYLTHYPMKAKPQKGKATYFRRRKSDDNELNINRSIGSQFNKMRVSDNERYPLNFRLKGKRYILKIYSAEDRE